MFWCVVLVLFGLVCVALSCRVLCRCVVGVYCFESRCSGVVGLQCVVLCWFVCCHCIVLIFVGLCCVMLFCVVVG